MNGEYVLEKDVNKQSDIDLLDVILECQLMASKYIKNSFSDFFSEFLSSSLFLPTALQGTKLKACTL